MVYSTFTPTSVRYAKGSRPFFENVLKGLLAPGMTEWQKFTAITRWVTTRQGWPPRSKSLPRRRFHGGTEEEIVLKGGGQCNETARLLTTILAVAGIPARQIGHWSAAFRDAGPRVGHMTNEVYVNGKWVYVDATKGLMVPRGKGWASAWDLRQNPDLIRCCPDQCLTDPKGLLKPDEMRAFLLRNFDESYTLLTVTNYPIDQRHLYSYDYFVPSKALRDHFREQGARSIDRLRLRVGKAALGPQTAAQAPERPARKRPDRPDARRKRTRP